MNPTERPGGATDAGAHDVRQLDLAALKALSHPLRLELLELLSGFGPQTASGLAARVGESSGSTSYHLRQLARHGLVREVEGRGTARERWWERAPGAFKVSPDRVRADESQLAAARIVERGFEQHRAQALADFVRFGDRDLPAAWMDAAALGTMNVRLDEAQLRHVSERVHAFLDDLLQQYRDRPAPEGRPVQIHFNAFPLIDPSVRAGESPEGPQP